MQTLPTTAATTAWRLQDAKAQFSALVDGALRGVPQHVTRRGKQAVVVLSEQDFQALQRSAANAAGHMTKPMSLIDHLLAIPKVMPKAMPKAASNTDTDTETVTERMDVQPRAIDFS